MSRLNSAAPYNTQACPPMSRDRTWWFQKVERPVWIGFGIKGASQGQELLAQALALAPALGGSHLVPVEPFGLKVVFWTDEFHREKRCRWKANLSTGKYLIGGAISKSPGGKACIEPGDSEIAAPSGIGCVAGSAIDAPRILGPLSRIWRIS